MKHFPLLFVCMCVMVLLPNEARAHAESTGHSFFGEPQQAASHHASHETEHHRHHGGDPEESRAEKDAREFAEKIDGTLAHRVKGLNKAQAMRVCQKMLDEMAGHVDEVEEKVFHEEAALGSLVSKKSLAGRIRTMTMKKIRYDIAFFKRQLAFYKDVIEHEDTPEDIRDLVKYHLLTMVEQVTSLMEKRIRKDDASKQHRHAKHGGHSFFGHAAPAA